MTVAVIGSGPAGMLAAIMIARTGRPVRLLDEQTAAGGHLSYDRYPLAGGATSDELFNELATALMKTGLIANLDSVVWAAFRSDAGVDLALCRKGVQESITCDQVIFATGTTDRSMAIPGCTLPGVMTARAARILGERHGVVPGERFAIVGAGTQAERLGRDIAGWGARVEVMADVESVKRVGGQDSVQTIDTAEGMTAVDVVVIAAGELPDVQLPGMLGLERVFDADLGGWRVPPRESLDGVQVVGGASLGGALISDVLRDTIDAVSAMTGNDSNRLVADLSMVQALIAAGAERHQ